MPITLTQTKDEMFFVYDTRRRDWLNFTRKKQRLRISISKRLQHFVPAQKIDVDVGERQLIVQSQARLQRFVGKNFARNVMKGLGKEIEIFFAHSKTGRHLMPAIFVEAIGATIQRFDQIQSFDASSAAFAHAVLVETDHNRGAMIFSNNT